MTTGKKQPFSFTSRSFLAHPYPIYDDIRTLSPICWLDSFLYPGWYVTGYEEAKAVLKDTRFKSRIPLPERKSSTYEQLKNVQKDMLLFKNEPDHQRLRRVISKGFTPKAITSYQSFVTETIEELLEGMGNKKRVDLVSDFAFPLPSLVIAKILGIPEKDHVRFREWSRLLIRSIDFTRSTFILKNSEKTVKNILDYFQKLIQLRKQQPQRDVISQLIHEEQGGEELTDDELLATCILLVIAGHETTTNLISNMVFSFLQHPGEIAKLLKSEDLAASAVEETLRFESPTQMTARIVSQDMNSYGVEMKKGDQVYVLLGAANRDPLQFREPEKFRIDRDPNPHLAFGYGSHFCIGAPLTRMEARLAVLKLFKRYPTIQLHTGQLSWRRLTGFRALKELPVTF